MAKFSECVILYKSGLLAFCTSVGWFKNEIKVWFLTLGSIGHMECGFILSAKYSTDYLKEEAELEVDV